jgi:hypothetical protein
MAMRGCSRWTTPAASASLPESKKFFEIAFSARRQARLIELERGGAARERDRGRRFGPEDRLKRANRALVKAARERPRATRLETTWEVAHNF